LHPFFINMEMKDRIQQKAKELFMRYGFRSVTMDEIAGQLGISKKTVYQFFEDKDSLVEAVMQKEMTYMHDECIKQMRESENAIEEIFKDMDSMEKVIDSMNPQIIFDLEKFYPETFEKFKKHKHTFLLDIIKKNLQRGIQEELYRNDFDVDIIARFRLESSFIAFSQEIFPFGKYNLLQVSNEIYYHYIHGIATPKGKKLIEKHMLQRQKNKSFVI
jgi:TetR/AcrR family transcriptional regulator, cholesterol catabolism regulator